MWRRTLYYGDNLDILRAMLAESVDLVYPDPPFNSRWLVCLGDYPAVAFSALKLPRQAPTS